MMSGTTVATAAKEGSFAGKDSADASETMPLGSTGLESCTKASILNFQAEETTLNYLDGTNRVRIFSKSRLFHFLTGGSWCLQDLCRCRARVSYTVGECSVRTRAP
jgi:hypothetical protein